MLEWELSEAFGRGVGQFNLVERHPSEQLRRGRFPEQPLRAFRVERGKAADVIGLSDVSLYAVSPAFVAAAEGLTGLAFAELDLADGPTGYAILGVTGVCGRADYRRAEVVGRLGKNFLRLRGLFVDNPEPGTDFAMPVDRESILLSSKAATQLESAHLSNLRLERMAEVRYDIPNDRLSGRTLTQRFSATLRRLVPSARPRGPDASGDIPRR